jgi:DNA-binding MarR family transcriptional regulator
MSDYLSELDVLFNRTRRVLFLELENRLVAAGYTDLGPATARSLMPIAEEGFISLSTLASDLGLHKATVTSLANRLEKAGYVSRRTDENDGRVSYLELTERGKSAARTVDSILTDLSNRAFVSVTTEERAVLRRTLFQVITNLGG